MSSRTSLPPRTRTDRTAWNVSAAVALTTGILVWSITASLRADVLLLEDGRRWEGDVTLLEDGKRVRIVVNDGVTLEFPSEQVAKIEQGESQADIFESELARLREEEPLDLDALVRLATRGHRQGLRERASRVFRQVLEIDPHHAQARRALGYVVHRNRWVREKELRQDESLVEHEGEWLTRDEARRRQLESLRKRLREDFRGVDSENRDIRAYSIKRLRELEHPFLREGLLEFVADSREAVRVVAVQALAEAQRKHELRRDAPRAKDLPEVERRRLAELEERIGEALVERTLREESHVVKQALYLALLRMRHEPFFSRALEVVTGSEDAGDRRRAAQGMLYALRKAWVYRTIDALAKVPPGVGGDTNPSIHWLLQQVFDRDLGGDPADWRRWWKRNEPFYVEEEG